MDAQKNDTYFAGLAEKWLQGRIGPEEEAEFLSWYHAQDDGDDIKIPAAFVQSEEQHRARIFAAIQEKIKQQTVAPVHRIATQERGRHFMSRFRWVAAAVVLFAIAGTYLFVQKQSHPAVLSQAERLKNDIRPGRAGSILTLSDGREIMLDTVQNGEITAGFTKNTDALSVEENTVEYAVVTTPKARIQSVVLSDGTQVWLNAGSSIRFPTTFKGSTREVSITGEVYFEVAKNKTKRFIVSTGTDKIEVLGTHFNINAYAQVKTTLLEGSVKIGTTILAPGMQYSAGRVVEPDTEEVMSWKNGMFRFSNTNIKEIMAQVERWYDVEVVYEGDVSNLDFSGGVPRDANISELLKKLELTRSIQFTIEGKKVIVRP